MPSLSSSALLYGTRLNAVRESRHFVKGCKESISLKISPVPYYYYYLPVAWVCVLAYWAIWQVTAIGNWRMHTHTQTWTARKYEIMEVNGRHISQAGQRSKTHLLFFTLLYYSIFDIQITHTLTLMYLCNREEGCSWCSFCCCKICRCFEQLNGSAIGSVIWGYSAAVQDR